MPEKVQVMPIDWQKRIFIEEFSKVKAPRPDSEGFTGGLHETLKPVICVIQCAALLPVKGAHGRVEDLKCCMKSFRMLYSCVICLVMFMMFLLSVVMWLKNNFAYDTSITVMYYFLLYWNCIHFIQIARKWPRLMAKWIKIERILPQSEEHLCNQMTTKKKLFILILLVTTLTIIEEILAIIGKVNKVKRYNGIRDSMERYFKYAFPQIFAFENYHEVTAIFAQIIHLYATFILNFVDMFVVSISIILSSIMRQFNARLLPVEGKCMTVLFWAQQKKHYQMICNLIDMMDKTIAHIIVQIFFSNLYYICVQLFNSVNNMTPWIYCVYFWFSLLYLIARTVGICLFGAEIHTESKKPADVLRKIPTEGWNVEAKRFLELINNQQTSLTGNGYFFITRPLLLSLIGTIVTYELVIMQFNENDTLNSTSSNLCG